MKVKLKNGKIIELVGEVSGVFDNGDGYTYKIPVEDLDSELSSAPIVIGYKELKTTDRHRALEAILNVFVDHAESFISDELEEIYEKLTQMGYELEDIT